MNERGMVGAGRAVPYRLLVTVVATFVVAAVAFTLLARSSRPSSTPRAGSSVAAEGVGGLSSGLSTPKQIAILQTTIRAHPGNAQLLAALGGAYLQRVRENGDAGLYVKADGLLRQAIRIAPRDPSAVIGSATLALARHDFAGGLRLARLAQRIAPSSVGFYPALVDAEVELGRYGAADRDLQRFVDRRPTLASYARVSYVRELHGHLQGALQAMTLAVSAGGQAPESVAYVQTLVGNLQFALGHLTAARAAYRQALYRLPDYVAASVGLAGVQAAHRDFAPAIARLRTAVQQLPLPQNVVALGETELAAGRTGAARQDLALVRVEERLLNANGVNTDVDLALFEANHGSPTRAVRLARRAWAQAPSVRSADALAWALTSEGRARQGLPWARRALHLGSRDAMVLYHAGITARDAGLRTLARQRLRAATELNPRFSPLYGPRAIRALRDLG